MPEELRIKATCPECHCQSLLIVKHGNQVNVSCDDCWYSHTIIHHDFDQAVQQLKNTELLLPYAVLTKALNWVLSGDVGLSSRFMVMTLVDGIATGVMHYPHDSNDFLRCLNAIKAIPEIKARLSLLKQCGTHWCVLVDNWDHLESVLELSGMQALYHEMRRLYDSIED